MNCQCKQMRLAPKDTNGKNTGCVTFAADWCNIFYMSFNIYCASCRCLVECALKELEKQRLEYEKSPENHPLYPDEWKIFWNRRYKELQAGL